MTEKDFQHHPAVEAKEIVPPEIPSFITSLEASLAETDQRYLDRLPDNYLEIQARLVKNEWQQGRERLTVFHGGPMYWHKHGIEDGWMTPIEVAIGGEDGKVQKIMFHLLSIDCNMGENLRGVSTRISCATDDDLKLKSFDYSSNRLKQELFTKEGRRAVLRPAMNGSLAFPEVRSSYEIGEQGINQEKIKRGIALISQKLGLVINQTPEKVEREIKDLIDKQTFVTERELYPGCFVGHSKKINTDSGLFFVTEVADTNADNAWKFYKIYTAQPIEEMDLSDFIKVRIDSGCDMGMNYDDGGCDCHNQLILSLKKIQSDGGVIIHLSTQDGRGYGANTKCLTEGMKWQIDVVGKQVIGEGQRGTTEVAEEVFGSNYDIRSYRHAAMVLQHLGLQRVEIMTDNNRKLRAIENILGKEKVRQDNTDTIKNMIEKQEDPRAIAQMLIKLHHDPKYSGITEETVNAFLAYCGINYSSKETKEKKIKRIEKSFSTSRAEDTVRRTLEGKKS